METLAFVYAAVNGEGSTPHSQESSPLHVCEGTFQISKAVVAGLTGFLTSLSFAIAIPNAQAFVMRGDRCPAVGKVQQALINRDYPVGTVDNFFGESTVRAVIRFQQIHNLIPDGVVGPGTAAALGISDPAFRADGPCSASSPVSGSLTAIVSTIGGGGINVRSLPNGPIVGSLANGTTVSITNNRQMVGGVEWIQLADGTWVAVSNLSIGGAFTPPSGTMTTAIVSTPTGIAINVRSFPNGPIVGSLANGATVSVTTNRQMADGIEWIQLADGTWVAARNLIIGGTGAPSPTTFTAIVSTPTGLGINIRSAPSGPIVGSLANGSTISVTTNRQTAGGIEWIQLADGTWVAAENLRQF